MTMETPPYASDDYLTKPTTQEPAEAKETSPEDSEADKLEDDAELVRQAKERYRLGIDASARWREQALEDLEFLAGEQWDSNVKGERDAQGRPALTVNRLPQFVRQVTNEQRQSKPAVTVSPVDDESDIKTAEVLQGIIRNVEYTSNADAAYAAGGQAAAITGLGYWDVAAEFESERSFEQRLTIRRIRNPLAVVMDPSTKELAGDDARWVIISTDISKAEWEAENPGKEPPRAGDWSGVGDGIADWVTKDGVRIHEYRYVTETPDTLYDIREALQALPELGPALEHAGVDTSSGAVLESEVGATFAEKLKAAKVPTRPTTRRSCCFAKICGEEVIERNELAGRYLQLVRVVGAELEINGKAIYEGVIRHAKDTQRALNYFVSAETEAIALAPKAPFVAAEGQIEGHETEWESANQRPQSVLIYRPVTLAGVAVPPPQRVMAEANIQAITTARQQAGQDLSEVTGIYPTQFGAPSPEQSGRAILARQNQGQTSNFHFTDNLAAAIRYTGRILVDLIPKIYSGPRVMRILGEDEAQEMVPVNGAQGDFRGKPAINQDGSPVIQLDAGRYDVAVSMGPSYLSRRQEAAAQMMELVRVNPQIGQIAGDLLVAAMDIPGGQAISDRLKKLLPPEIRPQDDEQPPPQVLAQQLQQSQALIQQLTQAVHQAHDMLDMKSVESASKERIALIQSQTELVKTAATIQSSEAQALLDHTAALIAKRLELDGVNQPPAGAMQAQPQPQPMQPQGVPNGRPTGPIFSGQPGPGAGAPGGGPTAVPGAPGVFSGGLPGGGPGGLPGR